MSREIKNISCLAKWSNRLVPAKKKIVIASAIVALLGLAAISLYFAALCTDGGYAKGWFGRHIVDWSHASLGKITVGHLISATTVVSLGILLYAAKKRCKNVRNEKKAGAKEALLERFGTLTRARYALSYTQAQAKAENYDSLIKELTLGETIRVAKCEWQEEGGERRTVPVYLKTEEAIAKELTPSNENEEDFGSLKEMHSKLKNKEIDCAILVKAEKYDLLRARLERSKGGPGKIVLAPRRGQNWGLEIKRTEVTRLLNEAILRANDSN